MSGDLAEGLLPSLLREIYVGRRNGWLHLSRGEERQSLRFKRGHIVNAHTNVIEERLGEMLVRQGKLSETDLARATEIVIRDKKRLGAVLMELGLIDASGLEDAVATHAYETLARVFSWAEGRHAFEPEEETPEGEVTLKLSTGELILAAVRAIGDPRAVRAALGDMDRTLTLSNDPILRFQKLTLSPADGFLLSRVDGTATANEIVQMSPLSSEEAERSLLGLLSTGSIGYSSEPRRARRAAPGPAAANTPASPRPQAQPAQAPPPQAAPAARAAAQPPPQAPRPLPQAPPQPMPPKPPPAAIPAADAQRSAAAAAEEKAEERRREILGLFEGLKARNHFEVLGLSRGVGEPEVKEAYFRLAKRFHPDVHHGTALGDLHDELEAIFIRLGEAYEALRDPRRRGEYEARLGRPRPVPASGSAAPPAPGERPEGAEAQAGPAPTAGVAPERAEEAVGQAVKLFEQQKYWDAIQLLEPVLHAAQGRVRTRGRLLLARAYLKNPKWARRAEETLLELTREDPKVANAWALLGGIYVEKGMRARALSMYKKTLELEPGHEEAQRFTASQPPEPPAEPPEPPAGLLRKLFRKP